MRLAAAAAAAAVVAPKPPALPAAAAAAAAAPIAVASVAAAEPAVVPPTTTAPASENMPPMGVAAGAVDPAEAPRARAAKARRSLAQPLVSFDDATGDQPAECAQQ